MVQVASIMARLPLSTTMLCPAWQLILHRIAVDLQKGRAAAGELLHNKSLAAEKASSRFLLKEDGQLHPLFRGQKAAFLHTTGWAGSISTALMDPGKLEAKAIIPAPPWAV